jgi:hypothetical protein
LCKGCGLPPSEHDLKPTGPNGAPRLHCRLCKDKSCPAHGLSFKEHVEKGVIPQNVGGFGFGLGIGCGPWGCPPRQQPPLPPVQPMQPPQQQLPNLFPENGAQQPPAGVVPQEEFDALRAAYDKAVADSKHPLDNVSGGHGTAVQNTSFAVGGALAGSMIWNYVLMPWLIGRTGKLPARLIAGIGKAGLKQILKKKGVTLPDLPDLSRPTTPSPPADGGVVTPAPSQSNILSEIEKLIDKKFAEKFPKLSTLPEIDTLRQLILDSIGRNEHITKILTRLDSLSTKLEVIGLTPTKLIDLIAELKADVAGLKGQTTEPAPTEQTTVTPAAEFVAPFPTPVSVDGLSRARENFQTPFKKTATAEQIMKILGDIQNEYGEQKLPTNIINEMLRQRLKILYGIE